MDDMERLRSTCELLTPGVRGACSETNVVGSSIATDVGANRLVITVSGQDRTEVGIITFDEIKDGSYKSKFRPLMESLTGKFADK